MSNSVGKKDGFTIIEVMLFLALTGLVFVGVVGGTNGNLAKERYRDSVQDIANQLKTIYTDVRNVEIPVHSNTNPCVPQGQGWAGTVDTLERNRGRTICAVYGRIVSIYADQDGKTHIQSTTVFGNDYLELTEKIRNADKTVKYTDIWPGSGYYINGQDQHGDKHKQAADLSTLSDLDLYKILKVDYAKGYNGPRSTGASALDFELKDYQPQWGATIVKKQKAGEAKQNLRAFILIVRSPVSGVVHTYVNELDLDAETENGYAANMKGDLNRALGYDGVIGAAYTTPRLQDMLTGPNEAMKKQELRLCIDSSNETAYGGQRRMIKIAKDAHNETGVELVNFDMASEEDMCQ